jgi:2-C-methyl-D-erythritol 4-phosphate cytidylyltransferase
MPHILIIPAAGIGARLGRPEPKALVSVAGRPLLSWTLEALAPLDFRAIVVAAPSGRLADFELILDGRGQVVAGGLTRSASVRRAFEASGAAPGEVVCIHDAARPLVSATEASLVISAAERSGAAIAASPVVDTLKKVDGEKISNTLDREKVWAAGTPQAFRTGVLRQALASGRETTDEAALCEALSIPVAVVPVSRLGFKITTPEDLEIVDAILNWRLNH